MATVYYDQDADLSLIQGRKIAVLGSRSVGKSSLVSNIFNVAVDVCTCAYLSSS